MSWESNFKEKTVHKWLLQTVDHTCIRGPMMSGVEPRMSCSMNSVLGVAALLAMNCCICMESLEKRLTHGDDAGCQ